MSPLEVANKIAYAIEAELICCSEYDDFNGDKNHVIKHQICWWGSYARSIALDLGRELND